jgi:hypothetical protein
MRTYLISLGFDIWSAIKNGYTTPLTDATIKRINDNNAKAMNAILCGLEEP